MLDSSAGGEPLAYIQGHGNLVAGLERALEGRQEGNSLAWWCRRRRLRHARRIARSTCSEAHLARRRRRKKGMQFQARTEDGMRLFTVTAVIGDMVTLDGNHPLADQNLHFEVQVVGVREATAEELEHGHVHGAGGHHH